MPIQVYLDSSDYSTLSDTRRLSPEITTVRERLLAWAASGEVEFRYSGVHISEMSPQRAQDAGAAAARADMLVSLCGSHCLFEWHVLVESEIMATAQDSGPPTLVYSNTGDWFPKITDFVSPVAQLDLLKRLDQSAREQRLNRAQRRALNQTTLKRNRVRASAKKSLLAKQEAGLKEMLSV